MAPDSTNDIWGNGCGASRALESLSPKKDMAIPCSMKRTGTAGGPCVAELLHQLSECNARLDSLRGLRRQCVKVERAQRRQHRRRLYHIMDVAFIVFVRSCPDYEPVARCFEKLLLDSHGVGLQELRRALEERYLLMSPAILAQLCEGCAVRGMQTALRKAMRFEDELTLYGWINRQNREKGIAPSYKMVQSQYQISSKSLSPREGGPDIQRPDGCRAKWVQRFRKRWSLVRASMPVRNLPSVLVLREKVPVYVCSCSVIVFFLCCPSALEDPKQ